MLCSEGGDAVKNNLRLIVVEVVNGFLPGGEECCGVVCNNPKVAHDHVLC